MVNSNPLPQYLKGSNCECRCEIGGFFFKSSLLVAIDHKTEYTYMV